MASHQLIDDYVGSLRERLPADAADELTDGLLETWQAHLGGGLTAERAARAAIAEFGTADRITDAFVAHSPGRRIARLLLATGPVMGACWGTGLITAKAWSWPIPPALGASYAIALLTVVAVLVAAASSRHSYRRTRLGGVGALILVGLDGAMIATVAALALPLMWPMAIAVTASIARIGLTINLLPKGSARRW